MTPALERVQKQVREYLHRLKVAGLDRGERCRMPMELPQ